MLGVLISLPKLPISANPASSATIRTIFGGLFWAKLIVDAKQAANIAATVATFFFRNSMPADFFLIQRAIDHIYISQKRHTNILRNNGIEEAISQAGRVSVTLQWLLRRSCRSLA
jgi:hypothetical protein